MLNFVVFGPTLRDMSEEPADPNDDWKTAKAAESGDTSAFKSLVDKYSRELLKFLICRLGKGAAEDVLSEVWLRVWRAISKGDYQETHFRGWVFHIARNLIIDWRRKQSRIPVPTEENHSIPDRSNGPEMVLELKERQSSLQECFEILDSKYPDYSAVARRIYQGLPHEEIAEELGISLEISHKRLFKARKGLIQCMEHKGWLA